MYKDGRWTPEEIHAQLGDVVGQERFEILERLKAMAAAAEKGETPNQ